MGITAQELADLIDGEVVGDPSVTITDGQSIDVAESHHVTFVADKRNMSRVANSRAGIVILPTILKGKIPEGSQSVFILVKNAESAFHLILGQLRPQRPRVEIGISSQAQISPSAKIGEGTNIYPGAYLGDDTVIGDRCDVYPGVYVGPGSQIGNDCVLHPYVVLYPDCVLKDRVILHSGTVVGADGFGYRQVNGTHVRVPHLGNVLIEEDVEIGVGCSIDRSVIGSTLIGAGTKIDNLVVVAHNCELGKHNLLVSQVGFAGSVTTGDYVVCAGQVGIADHVHLGTGSVFGAKSGVHRDMPGGKSYLGLPAAPVEEMTKQMIAATKLPEMRHTLRALEKEIAQLNARIEQLESSNSSANAA